MTAVQWWCTGVVLDRIFTPNSSQQGHATHAANKTAASAGDGSTQNSQSSSSHSVGKVLDRMG